ncbi:MAG: hypothetical protein H0X24_02720 [Ktedonobacterales bacterium]|nr:hypothetical protein [Ktedonobacterales bacterium]
MTLFTTTAAFLNETAVHAAQLAKHPPKTFKGHPNTYHPPKAPDRSGPYPGPQPVSQKPVDPKLDTTIHHGFVPTMPELSIPLTQTIPSIPGKAPTIVSQPKPITIRSADGQLEVQVPTGVVSATDVAANGNSNLHLVIDQIEGPSGSTNNAGGSGRIAFGSYEFQIQDAAGHEATLAQSPHTPFTLVYHLPGSTSPVSFDLDRMVFSLNGTHRLDLPHPMTHPGAPKVLATTMDATAHAFAVIVPLGSTGTGTFSATSPVGYFGSAQNFQTNLHTGGLSYSIPIDTPTGQGGLTPALHLDYDSEAVSGTHNPQAAAGWVGQGWSLDPGEITWSESNFMANNANGTSTPVWQNAWTYVDANGSASPLIPPKTNLSTFKDDTGNAIATTPTVWHTANESHAKIISYPNPTVDCTNFPAASCTGGGSYTSQPPCWRIWLPNGTMEEFGCTFDSRQWYPTGTDGTKNYLTDWKLDLITDAKGNQIHFGYAADTAHNSHNVNYPRDLVLTSVTWNAANCHDANTQCTGVNWNPTMEVVFSLGHAVTHAAPGVTNCVPAGSLRCDDPQGTATESTPLITPTEVLNDVTVKVLANSTWNTLKNYQLAYEDKTQGNVTDPFTGNSQALAGYLLLEQVTTTGTDSTAYPLQTFKYSVPDAEYFLDSSRAPVPTTNCVKTWNTGKLANGTGSCRLLIRTYASFFMSEADNNQGLQQTFTWKNMRNNTHGVYTAAAPPDNDPTHAYACTDLQASSSTGYNIYPCDMADDSGWSHISLVSRTATENTPTSANSAQQLISTWSYNYNLTSLTAKQCADCSYGMYGGDTNNGDYLDFYNGRFAGFSFAQVVNPDSSLENDYYYTTMGWGVWDKTVVACHNGFTCDNAPSWNVANAASGFATQVDHFDVKQGSTWNLLKRDLTAYTVTCPPSGVTGSPSAAITYWGGSTTYAWGGNLVGSADLDNPVAACDIHATQSQTYAADGTASPTNTTNPHGQTAIQYNAYGQVTQTTITGEDLGTTPTTVSKSDYIYNDNVSTSGSVPTGTYIVTTVAHKDTEDGSGNIKGCSFSHYDGSTTIPVPTGQQASLTKGLLTQADVYATTCTSTSGTGIVSSKAQYSTSGDPINSIDADAVAGISGHTATTGSCIGFTACTTFDSIYGTLPIQQTNAFNQNATIAYTTTSAYGFGMWPSSATDPNGKTTSTTYDGLGRALSTTLPSETTGLTTRTMAYSPITSCATTGAAAPCEEMDETQRLSAGLTVTTRHFYDGWGHEVETRKPATAGSNQDVVQYTLYDTMGRVSFASTPYYVTAYTGSTMGNVAYAVPNTIKVGTSYTYDGLGRTLSTTRPDTGIIAWSFAPICVSSICYEQVVQLDYSGIKTDVYKDALGRTIAAHTYDAGIPPYTTITYAYDYVGRQISMTLPDGTHTATTTYDLAGHPTAKSDPDLGNWSYTRANA